MRVRLGLLCLLTAFALAVAPVGAQAATGPTVVTGAASELTPSSVTLDETITPNGESTQAGFDYGTSVAYGSSSPPQTAGAGTAPVSLRQTITGLAPGTTYHFRAVASNASGTAAGQDATFTTPAAPQKPSTTTGAASAVSLTQATLSSSTDPNGQSTKVTFDYGPSTAYGDSTAGQDAGAGSTAVTIKATVKGLRENTTYHFRSRAVNAAGTTLGSDRTFKTSAPRAPAATTGSAIDVVPTAATLVGTVDPNGRATKAYAEFGTSTAYGNRTQDVDLGSGDSGVAFRAPATGLAPLVTYHFRVVALSDGGTVRGHDRTFKTPSVATVVGLTALPNPVRWASTTRITGRLQGSGAPGAPLTLVAIPYPFTSAGSTVAGPVAAGRDGSFAFSVRPRVRTRYVVHARAGGQDVVAAPFGVRVGARVSLRIRRSARRLRLSGRFRPSGPAVVSVRRVTATGTVSVRRVRVVSGRFALSVRRGRRAARYVARVVPAGRAVGAGLSPVRAAPGRG